MEMINRLVVARRGNGLGLRKQRVAEYQRGIYRRTLMVTDCSVWDLGGGHTTIRIGKNPYKCISQGVTFNVCKRNINQVGGGSQDGM